MKEADFACLYEIDPENPLENGFAFRITKVLCGNENIKYAKKVDSIGREFYMWKDSPYGMPYLAYYYHLGNGAEMFEVESDEQALLYFKLKY
jgi:hypothetical protein